MTINVIVKFAPRKNEDVIGWVNPESIRFIYKEVEGKEAAPFNEARTGAQD